MRKSLSSVVYLCKCNSCTVGTHYFIWRYYTTDLKWIIYGVVIIYHKYNNFMDLWVKLDPIQMLVSTTCLVNTKVYKSKVFNSDSCLHRVLIFVNISLQDKKWATAPGAPPHTVHHRFSSHLGKFLFYQLLLKNEIFHSAFLSLAFLKRYFWGLLLTL